MTISKNMPSALFGRLARKLIPARYRPIGYLTHFTQRQCGYRVHAGPFRGMRYVNDSLHSAYIPKLLGIYERELHSIWNRIVDMTWDLIVYIGAAEGYYAAGFAIRCPRATVVAFEMDPSGQAALSEMCRLNSISSRVEIRGKCTPAELAHLLPPQHPALVICDVEGGEDEILDPKCVPGLLTAHVLVELHEFVVSGVTGRIVERFRATHNITQIWQQPRDPSEYPFRSLGTRLLPRRYLEWAVSEWRPERMSWLWMQPL